MRTQLSMVLRWLWQSYFTHRRSHPTSFWGVVLFVALCNMPFTIALLGHRLPPAVSHDLLYLVPLGIVTWWQGRWPAWYFVIQIGFARWLFAADPGIVVDASQGPYGELVSAWNILTFGIQYALFAWLLVALRDALARERRAARLDPLTGLFNRRAFNDELRAAAGDTPNSGTSWHSTITERITRRMTRRCRRPQHLAIAYFDLDGFKGVNDTLGHEAGDAVLREMARVLRGAVRTDDRIARLGGDEFAVLLPGADADVARAVAERVAAGLMAVADPQGWDIGVSAGVAAFESSPSSAEDALRSADALMYEAKRSGGRRVKVARVQAGAILESALAAVSS